MRTHTNTHTHKEKKCAVVLQGMDRRDMSGPIAEYQLCRKLKYLGNFLGNTTTLQQFHSPLPKVQLKAQHSLGLLFAKGEKVQGLDLCAYPVFRHAGTKSFPIPAAKHQV